MLAAGRHPVSERWLGEPRWLSTRAPVQAAELLQLHCRGHSRRHKRRMQALHVRVARYTPVPAAQPMEQVGSKRQRAAMQAQGVEAAAERQEEQLGCKRRLPSVCGAPVQQPKGSKRPRDAVSDAELARPAVLRPCQGSGVLGRTDRYAGGPAAGPAEQPALRQPPVSAAERLAAVHERVLARARASV